MRDDEPFAWSMDNVTLEKMNCEKDRVYVLSCGTETYVWFVLSGVLFTASQTETSDTELANSIWEKGDIIHSFDKNIMLPFHTLTDSVIACCRASEFDQKVQANARLSWLLAIHYHDQFRFTLLNYRHAALDPSESRLEALERYFDNIEDLDEKISDSTLALFMGMHRVSVNRIRKKLEARKTSDENESDDEKTPPREKQQVVLSVS